MVYHKAMPTEVFIGNIPLERLQAKKDELGFLKTLRIDSEAYGINGKPLTECFAMYVDKSEEDAYSAHYTQKMKHGGRE